MIVVIAVDPHPIIQSGIQFLIAQRPDMQYGGAANSIQESIALIERVRPNVAVINLPLPVDSGFAQLAKLHQLFPKLGVVVLTSLQDSVFAERCLHGGAHAFLFKRAPSEEILKAIDAAARDEVFCSEELRERLLKRAADGAPSYVFDPSECLSNAETNVFEMIGDGMTIQHIAKQMNISAKTVETYKIRIKKKLGIPSSAELTHYAILQRLGKVEARE